MTNLVWTLFFGQANAWVLPDHKATSFPFVKVQHLAGFFTTEKNQEVAVRRVDVL